MRGQASAAAVLVLLVLAGAVAFSGCGESGSSSGSAGASSADCLTPDQVREERDRIAEGFESSDEEVEAKRDEIAAVEAEEC